MSSFLQIGSTGTADGFDLNTFAHHIEVLQCALHASGQGEVFRGINAAGNDIRVIDTYMAGFS